MSIKYESGFSTILGLSLNSTDTVITLGVAPTVTKGRMYIFDGIQKEWVDFTGVSGVTITGCTRNVSKTADPMTGGTGYNFNAGTPVVLVAMHDQLPDKTTANTFVGDQTITGNASISGLLSFTGTDTAGLKIKSLTTTQRDALTPANGMKIYNSTTGTEQTYYGGQWNDAGTSTVANATDAITGKVRLADQTQVNNGTDTEAGDPLVVIPSTLKVVTDALAIIADLTLLPFGNGSDGDVVINSGTTTLTRDMQYQNLTVTSPGVLNPNGFRVFVRGTFSGTGTINRNGNNGGNGNIGNDSSLPVAGGIAGTALNQGTLNAEIAAPNGASGINAGNGINGIAGTAASPSLSNVSSVAGGAGGAGNGNGGSSGGASATSTRSTKYNQVINNISLLFHTATAQGITFENSKGKASSGSGGTGGGSGSNTGGSGGAAGGNGGLIWISTYIRDFTGTVTAIGGNGGNGGNGVGYGANNTGGGGGGGGGNGGTLLRMYHTIPNDCTKTLTGGSGGTGGTAGGVGASAGTNGTAGNAGETISIVI